MVLAVVVNESNNGAYDKSGSVLPFGVFETKEKAKELFEIEKEKEDSIYADNDILVCNEVEMNHPIEITNENWKEKVLLSYWHCE